MVGKQYKWPATDWPEYPCKAGVAYNGVGLNCNILFKSIGY